MAAVTHGVTLNVNTNATSYTTASFTPTSGDLLVVFTNVSLTAAAGSMSDSLGGSWTEITTAVHRASADKMWAFVRGALSDGSALTVTMDVTGDAGGGIQMFVVRISGLTKVGAAAIVQSAVQSNQTTGTPAPVFGANADTSNPTLGFFGENGANPAAMTPPTNWTEQDDVGHTGPTTGAEYVSRDLGFTGTTITWGSTGTGDSWGVIIVELDTSAPFPTVLAVNGGTQGTSTTSHTVNLPTGIQNGNLLFAVITVTGLPASGLATQITWPAGWTELYERIYDDAVDVGTQSLAFRRADGTEGGSIIVTTDDSVFSSHTSYRLTGHHATSDPEVGSAAVGNVNPDPPSLSPSWGAENTLWFALCGFSLNDDDITISGAPTNYTNLREDNGGAIGEQTSTGTARRELNAASENPGLFTLTTGRRWVANTLAILSAAAVVTERHQTRYMRQSWGRF